MPKHMDEVEPATYSVDQTSKVLGLSRAQTYESVNDGTIPSFRIGNRVLVPRKKLHALIDGE